MTVRDTSALFNRSCTYHKDLSINKIESISELILEDWLGFSDAIPEQDSPDEDSELTELEADYDCFHLFLFDLLLSTVQFLTTSNILFRPESFLVYVPEINAPPPQPIA
ncbi:hypothetical protein IC229_26410 [Spirosoma sp. BT702]|uniref:Uncharacterized protein n=2 Tax=Spirosoma profusum TaxID=2771354 RepID=A0A927APE1_9BACT|nr:hypothetical protein [Spirosoma profusum]